MGKTVSLSIQLSLEKNFVTASLKKQFLVDTKSIQKASSMYRAINHSVRLQITRIIHQAGTINVTPIIKKLKLEQSVVSAHLKILRDAKIVTAEKKGRTVFYSVNYGQVARMSLVAEKLVPYSVGTAQFHPVTDRKMPAKSKGEPVRFTPTELKIIRLVCQQNTSDEISEKLQLSRRTIEDYRSDIIRKMKVRNSVGILIYAIKNNLFSLDKISSK